MKRHINSGFTLIEALMVIAISLVMCAIAIPVFTNAMKNYYQSATVSAVTGAIESTRFQAIMKGYPYQIIFTSATLSYETLNAVPPALPTSFSPVVVDTPLPNAGGVSMTGGATFTYTFYANGTVTTPVGQGNMAISTSNLDKSTTITVSGVGNVSTTTTTP